MKKIGKLIASRRAKLGIETQRALGKRAKIAACTMSLIESGKRKIGPKVARRLEKALKMREGALVK